MMTTMNIWNYENSIVNERYDEHTSSSSFVYPNESTLFEDVGEVINTCNTWSRVIEGKD